jgi:hypothetical protein
MPVQSIHMHVTYNTEKVHEWSLPCHFTISKEYTNDLSAGSPTETFARVLLPLSDKVH